MIRSHPLLSASRVATLAAAMGGLLASATARGEVLAIEANGQVLHRQGAGAVAWTTPAEPVASAVIAAAGDEPLPPGAVLPPPVLTSVTAAAGPAAYRDMARRAALRAGISPALLEAVVWQESRWNPRARSSAGAIGLGQLMPGTARQLGVSPWDPAANLAGAATYLRRQLDRFDHDLERALAAYNAGPARVEQAGGVPPIAETRAYVSAITRRLAAATVTP